MHGTYGLNSLWHRTSGRGQAALQIMTDLPMCPLVSRQDEKKPKGIPIEGKDIQYSVSLNPIMNKYDIH